MSEFEILTVDCIPFSGYTFLRVAVEKFKSSRVCVYLNGSSMLSVTIKENYKDHTCFIMH